MHNIDGRFEDDTRISIYQDYFNPAFWKEIFSSFMEVNDNCKDENCFFESKDKLRVIGNRWHGYSAFDRLSIATKNLKRSVDANIKTVDWLTQRIYDKGL